MWYGMFATTSNGAGPDRHDDGGCRPNPATLHQGMRVRKGCKYILTKWFRERAAGA